MAGYGRFVAVEEVASRGPFDLFSARPAGEEGAAKFAIKAYRFNDAFGEPEIIEREARAFVEAAKAQQALEAGGAPGWAKIYDCGKTDDAAYYVTDLYPLTAQRIVDLRRELTPPEHAHIIDGVAATLIGLKAKDSRPHANLKPTNVLLGSADDIGAGKVVLADPVAPDLATADGFAQDLRELGSLLFQMVEYRQPPKGGEVAQGPMWQKMGPAGEALRSLCEALLTTGTTITLEQVRERLANLPKPEAAKGKGNKGLLLGVAAAVMLAGGAGLYFTVFAPQEVTPVDPVTGGDTPSGTGAGGAGSALPELAKDTKKDPRTAASLASVDQLLDNARRRLEKLMPDLTAEGGAGEEEGQRLTGAIAEATQTLARVRVMAWDEVEEDVPAGEATPPAAAEGAEAAAAPAEPTKRKRAVTAQERELIVNTWNTLVGTQLRGVGDSIAKAETDSERRLKAAIAEVRSQNEGGQIVRSLSLRRVIDAALTREGTRPVLRWSVYKPAIATTMAWVQAVDAEVVAGLDVALPEGTGVIAEPATDAIASRREGVLKAMADQLGDNPPGDPTTAEEAARRATAKQSLEAFAAQARAVLLAAVDIESALAAAYTLNEARAGGPTIQAQLDAIQKNAAIESVRPAVDKVLRRVAQLAEVEQLSDPAALRGAIEAADAPVSVVMAAWRRLAGAGFPANIADLQAATALRDRVLAALAAVPNAARRAELENKGVREVVRSMWLTFTHEKAGPSPQVVDAVFRMRGDLGVTAADEAKLEPWAAFNFERWKTLDQVRKVDVADPKKQLEQVQPIADALMKNPATAQASVAKVGAVQALMARLKPFAEGKDLDLTKEGPGGAGWDTEAPESEDGRVVFYSWPTAWGAPPSGRRWRLEFRRVIEDSVTNTSGYVCTTEVPVGLLADVLISRGALDAVAQGMRPANPDGRSGPRSWEWPPDATIRPASPNAAGAADKTGNGWMRSSTTNEMTSIDGRTGGAAYYENGARLPEPPSVETPANYVPAFVAIFAARQMGSRVPTVAEWQAAVSAQAQAGRLNRRDASWKTQWDYVTRIWPASNQNAEFPNAGIFRTRADRGVSAQNDGEAVVNEDDGRLWFAPVTEPAAESGAPFKHLLGNVAEFVVTASAGLDQLKPESPEVVRRALGRGETVRVIGASALSPPSYAPDAALEVTNVTGSFSDVGFRLAFTTGSGAGGVGKPAERLARALATTDYLTRATP